MFSIIGVFIAFIVVVWLLSKEINLGYAMFLGSVVVAITSGLSLGQTIETFLQGVGSGTTLELIITVGLIGVLAQVMEKTGLLTELIKAYSYIFRNQQLTAIFIPSIMGALPIPGGAIMSAPLVESIGDDIQLSARQKMAANMLYRHIWCFVFPFIPGLILASRITKVSIFTLIKMQFPITIVMGVVGYYILFDNNNYQDKGSSNKGILKVIRQLLVTTSPLLISFILPLLFDIPLAFGLLSGILLVSITKYDEFSWKLLLESFNYELTISIIGVMVFKEFINQGPDLELLTNYLFDLGLPILTLIIIMPSLVGYITGSISAAVGITFPLLISIVNQTPTLVMTMYGAAFFGYLISPVHFCLILTKDYFEIKIKNVYYDLFWPVTMGIATLVLLIMVY